MNKLFSGFVTVFFLVGMLFFAVDTQPVKAQETIYIRADGSVEGTTSIQTVNNVTYFFVADVNGSIAVERDNIVLDGAGHTLIGNGSGSGTGILVIGSESPFFYRTNVTVQNVEVTDFDNGIYLYICRNCTISGNNITSNHIGITFASASNNVISRNNLVSNFIGISVGSGGGIYDFNWIYHNNFIGNSEQVYWNYGYGPQVWDNGYPSGGNFWSDYNGTDLYSGQFQNESGSEGIGDSTYDMLFVWWHMGQYVFLAGQDRYPLTIPFGSNLPFAYPTARFTYTPIEPVAGQPVDFNASTSTCVNGTIARYIWDFEDGETGTGQTVSHVYSAYGNYNVSLTAISNTFIPDTKNQSIYVRQTPTANFSFSSTPAVGHPVTFNATASEPRGGSITSYLWDFGDGNTTSTDKPAIIHSFAFQNTFNVTLTVFDSENLNASFSNSVLVMMPTFVSLHTSSTSNIVGFTVNINGALTDFYGVPLEGKMILLSYTFPGASAWFPITSSKTDSAGEYSVTWIPTATGDFTLKAESSGNATHLDANSTVSLSTLPYKSEGIFSIESNSTIAALSFDSASSKLIFSVSGENNTMGYTKITIAKSLAKSAGDIKVYLDGSQTACSVTAIDDSWTVACTYAHSTHSFEIDLTTETSANGQMWEFYAIVSAGAVTIVCVIAVVFLAVKRSKHKEISKAS